MRQLLETLQTELDVALDFVEQVIGMSDFVSNWGRFKTSPIFKAQAQAWLEKVESDVTVDKLRILLDELASKETKWLTPFHTPKVG
jgi:hypothetical protein